MSVEPKGKGWMLETYPPWGRIASPECWIRYCALVTRLATGHPCRNGIATSAVKHLLVLANSFHEKAGVSQVCFSSSSPVVFSVRAEPPLSPSFHPHSFVERFSLGASWAFSFQQVLLPDTRRRLPSLGTEVGLGVSSSRLNSAVELGSPDTRLSAHPQDSEWRTSSLGRTGWPRRIRCRRSSWLSVRSRVRSRLAS